MVCDCERGETGLVTSIQKNRSCTDLLFLGLFVAFWVGTFLLLGIAHEKDANIDRLIRGVDCQDRICGVSEGVEQRPLAYWPNFEADRDL